MFKKILVPIDGSDTAWKALDQAMVLGKNFESDIVVVHVVEPYSGNIAPLITPWDSTELYQVNIALEEAGEKILDMAKNKLANYSKHVECILEVGQPAERIINRSKVSGCDLIVIGSRGLSGIADFLLGGVSSSVVEYATLPVLIVR
ncbi:MAG: universal stress protein [Acidaminococcaceae bacterium]